MKRTWETDFYTVVVLSFENSTAEFSASAPGVYKNSPPMGPEIIQIGCGFFAYSWKLPAYSGAFLLAVDNSSFFITIGAFLLTF